MQAILLGFGLQHKTVDELEVSISSAQADRTFRPHFTTIKAGLRVRRKHKHKHKPRVNRDEFSCACACVVPVHTWLVIKDGTQSRMPINVGLVQHFFLIFAVDRLSPGPRIAISNAQHVIYRPGALSGIRSPYFHDGGIFFP